MFMQNLNKIHQKTVQAREWKPSTDGRTNARTDRNGVETLYSRTSMARTPMARLPWMSRTRS